MSCLTLVWGKREKKVRIRKQGKEKNYSILLSRVLPRGFQLQKLTTNNISYKLIAHKPVAMVLAMVLGPADAKRDHYINGVIILRHILFTCEGTSSVLCDYIMHLT